MEKVHIKFENKEEKQKINKNPIIKKKDLQEKQREITNEKSANIQLVLNGNSKDIEESLMKYIEYFETKYKNHSKKRPEKRFGFISNSIIKKQIISNEKLLEKEFVKMKNFHESISKVEIFFFLKLMIFF